MKRKVLWRGKFLRIVGRAFLDKKKKQKVWECVERVNSRKIVAIFALTKNKEVLLVKQYRYPHEKFVVELPAGLADRKGEIFAETAKRELLEETGYRVRKIVKILEGPYNAGLSSDNLMVFFAPDVAKAGGIVEMGDDSEEIELLKIPLSGLVDFCSKKHKGFTVDIKILGTLKMLESERLV